MKALLTGTLVLMLCLKATKTIATTNDLNTGEITGKIIDSKSSLPLSYASVALIKLSDSSSIAGVITNNDGVYTLSEVPYGKYNLKVSYVGYKSTQINEIELSRSNKRVEVAPAMLEENALLLNEARVVHERLKGEEKVDRTVFTINDDVRNSSTSGLDVLKSIPSVTVDFQENVTLEGRSDIQYYVDGVLRKKEFVAQLDPKSIDKIELITNPGVKYDSDVSGIINIVMKKDKKAGVSGSVQIPVSHPDKAIFNPGANIEYGNSKFRVYVSERLHYERFKGSETLKTYTDSTYGIPSRYEKTGYGYNSFQNNYLNYGIDLFLSQNTSLNLLGEWQKDKSTSDKYSSILNTYKNNVLTEYIVSNLDSKENRDNHFLSAFFKHNFNKEGNELTAEINYYLQTNNNSNRFLNIYYNPEVIGNAIDTINRKNYTDNLRKTLEFKTDYSTIVKNIKLETGLRISNAQMNNNFTDAFSLESQTGELKNDLQYTESRSAAYINASGKFKGLNYQAGLKGEYSGITINDSSFIDYQVFLPQFSLSYNLKGEQSLKFSYRRQIYRPDINSLNPFETWSDSLHLRTGNPNLKPAIENQIEFSYAKNFGSNYISPKLFANYTRNGIQDLTVIRKGGITEVAQDNIGENMEYGLELNAAFQLFKIVRINANGSVFNRSIYSSQQLAGDADNQKVSYRINGSTSFQLPKDFSLFAFVNYGSPNIAYQREFSRDLLFLIGAGKKFSEKASIEMYYNPFIKNFNYTTVKTRSQGYYEEWAGDVQVQNLFAIEFTYNFNYGKKVNKIDRNVDFEKEKGGGRF